MSASVMTVDFTKTPDVKQLPTGRAHDAPRRPLSAEGKVLTPKQIRARARRHRKRFDQITPQEQAALYRKPIDEWDLEELARGRPKNSRGTFSGPAPGWVDRGVFERAMDKYMGAIKTEMRATTVEALDAIREILINDDLDEKGKPIVSHSTKLDAAKFLLEHSVGKPTQRIENDVSVKLQGILGHVIANPGELATGNYLPGHMPGVTMELATAERDDDDLLPEG